MITDMQNCRLHYSLPDSVSNITDLNSSFSLGSIRVAYTGNNYNHTSISKETFENCAASMFNCPIVANYNVETSEIGGHDMEVIETEDGVRYVNLTQPVGVVPESATYHWETLDDNGTSHDYFCIDGVILWKRQPCYAKLEQNGITSQSIEIAVNSGTMSDGIFNIEQFEFEAFCLLERDEPCFEQAALQVFSKDEFKQQWQDMLHEYAEACKPNEQQKETGGTQVDEVVKDPQEVVEEGVEETVVEQPEIPIEAPQDDPVITEDPIVTEQSYSLTANQLREALGRAFNEMNQEDDCYRYYVEDWDDSEVYVYDYDTGRIYGYTYTVSGESVSIDGSSAKEKRLAYVDVEENVSSNTALAEVISAIVDSSKASLSESYDSQIGTLNETISNLNTQVSELTEFKKQKLAAERAEQESALFAKFDTQLKNIAEYQVIKDNSANCTLDELEMQCYALIGKQNFSFSKEAPSVIKIPVDKSHSDSGEVYGGLLRNKSQI